MDLKLLASIPPWEWPPNGGITLLAVLGDRQAAESEQLLAAEMAGEIVAIDDQLAAAVLSLAGDPSASEPVRCRAALSLGPVLEHMDHGRDDYYLSLEEDTFAPPPISEHTFQRIQQSLRARYLEEDIPTEVRRRILEASVRAPADWHRGAVRAAYSREDRDWRLTAVFAMQYVSGFADEIVAALEDPDEEIRYEAVRAAGNWEVDAAWPHVAALLAAPVTDKALLLAAIEAAPAIRPREAEPLLADLSDSDDVEIADAASNAVMMATSPFDDEFDDDPEL